MGTHVLGRAPDGGRTVSLNRVIQHVLAVFLGDLAGDSGQLENVAIEEVQQCGLRSAQARGVLKDGVEYFAGVVGRTAKRREDLAARRPLMAGVP